MQLLEALKTRRSIRKYKDKPVSNNLLEQIIEYGMYAPSAVNKQPWHFIIFRNEDTINELINVHPNAAMLKQADSGILICYDKTLEHDKGYGIIDCSAATQNMLLAAHDMGLGACWIGIHPRQQRISALAEAFKLPEHIIPFAVVSVGYSNETKNTPDRLRKERIHYEMWPNAK